MNKRMIKKHMKYSKVKIRKMKPKENEIIVIEFDMPPINMAAAKSIFQGIKTAYNKVVAIPKGTSVTKEYKEDLIERIKNL